MTRVRSIPRCSLVAAIVASMLAVAGLGQLHGQTAAAAGHRIAVFGSSVANGTGDDLGREGYTGRLRELLAPRGWEVLNQSRPGDNTRTMAPRFAPDGEPDPKVRYLLPVNPNYVLLGLSLGNEGIQNGATKEEKDVIYHQFVVLHAQRLHLDGLRIHAPDEPVDQRVGCAERQLSRRRGRWDGKVGEGLLARLAASERGGTRGTGDDVRADTVRRDRAGEAVAGLRGHTRQRRGQNERCPARSGRVCARRSRSQN
jgi:hypothetical protein